MQNPEATERPARPVQEKNTRNTIRSRNILNYAITATALVGAFYISGKASKKESQVSDLHQEPKVQALMNVSLLRHEKSSAPQYLDSLSTQLVRANLIPSAAADSITNNKNKEIER